MKPMEQEQGQGNFLSSVKNAIKIMRAFQMDQPQKGVRELAAELGMGKSSVQRILATLASEGLVRKNEETGKYELGLSVLELSSIVLAHIDLHNEALPIIKSLAAKCKETSHLAVLDHFQVVYLSKAESEDSVKIASHTGFHNHLHCTSSGKLLLAFGEPYLAETVLQHELIRFTPYTITEPNAFRAELTGIRNRGYSFSIGEFRAGVTSVSAPVRDHTGKVIAAINLVGPGSRISNQRIQYFANELIRAGELISERLGYWKR